MKYERKTRVSWTNWTFGYWWGTFGKRKARGLDLGPLEIIWKEPKPPRQSWSGSRDILANKEARRPQPGEYPKPVQIRNRRPVPRDPSSGPFSYDSGPVKPDMTKRRDELAAYQERMRENRFLT